jgi:hypothetical protein
MTSQRFRRPQNSSANAAARPKGAGAIIDSCDPPAAFRRESRIWRSGVCAVVQKPFSLFSCHKLLIAFLAYRDDARGSWASSDCVFGVTQRTAEVSTGRRSSSVRVALKHLLNPLVWPINLLPRNLTKSRDSGGEAFAMIIIDCLNIETH